MQNIQIFNNEEFGNVRTVIIEGEPWFVGKDIAEPLGYGESHKAIVKHVDEEDRTKHPILTDGGLQDMWVVNESGLYSLILSSKLPSAKPFKHWVTSEVLPALRKTGTYSLNNGNILDAAVAGNVADLGRVTERIMKGQGSAPHKIAEAFLLECNQFGIVLPTDFVKVPEYEQMELIWTKEKE